jgi:hypothetical protein
MQPWQEYRVIPLVKYPASMWAVQVGRYIFGVERYTLGERKEGTTVI